MIYEGVTLVTEHLRDGAMGVNALRSTVPLAPGDPPLELVAVQSEFEVPYIAGSKIPESAYADGPLVLVRRADDTGEFSAPGHPEILSNDTRLGLAILVLFPRRSAKEVHHENRCLSALLRVVRRSLGMFLEDVPADARVLRDVQLTGLLAEPRVVPTALAISDVDLVVGAVLVDFRALDRWAEGITL